jgi:hypothetical protein
MDMPQSTTAAAQRADTYITNSFRDFLNNYKMRAKGVSSLSECAHWLTCQQYRENCVQNAHFVVFGVVSYELMAPELVQEFSAF